jgi:hypothetical protein
MEIEIEIDGITPLICNRFTDEAAEAATSGSRGSSAAVERDTPHDECQSRLYLVDDAPVIPQPNLLRCIVDGGSFFKIGKRQITTKKESMLYACADIHGVAIPILSKKGWTVDTRPVRIPATGGRILKHRPIFHDWRLRFTADLDAVRSYLSISPEA